MSACCGLHSAGASSSSLSDAGSTEGFVTGSWWCARAAAWSGPSDAAASTNDSHVGMTKGRSHSEHAAEGLAAQSEQVQLHTQASVWTDT